MTYEMKRYRRPTMIAALCIVLALVSPLAAQVPPCGDGTLDVGEECDEGPATGTPDSCCDIDCLFRPASTPCRDTTGECDPADVCSGSSGACTDVKRTDVCRASAGVCDIAESCDGVASDCPADAKSSAVCRAAAGVCDVAESCNGIDDDCPADDLQPTSVQCRGSAGVCDVAEDCTGSSAACPGDGFVASTSECRASGGVCDVAEHCTGSSAACPGDGFVASTSECRASGGACDVAEHCTGSSAPCPADGFASAAVECRADVGGCDVAEYCAGDSASCPGDGFEPDETPCDDANVCSINDRCIGGVCGGFLQSCGNGTIDGLCFEECDDGNLTPGDGCTESCRLEPCGPEPLFGCRGPEIAGKAPVKIVARPGNDKSRKLQWKYSPGATTPKADFGDPTDATSYQFCIYDEVAGDPHLIASYTIPPAGVCALGRPCWRSSSSGFKYVSKARTPNGIASLVLKQGLAPGKTKILLKGGGADLPVPVLPLIQSPNVVVQLKASNGVCWETHYGMPGLSNVAELFRDK